METKLELLELSRSIVDCVVHKGLNSEIEGGPTMARGTFYSTAHDPRGTIYSAMDGPGGPLIVRHDYIPLQQVTEDLIICLVLEETTDK